MAYRILYQLLLDQKSRTETIILIRSDTSLRILEKSQNLEFYI